MNRILSYLPLSKPFTGAVAAQRFDEAVFDAHQALDAFCRPMIEAEFSDAPEALRAALDTPLMRPFRVVVEVRRGSGELFPPAREVLQVQVVLHFDRRRPGVLRDGFLTNNTTDRQPTPLSKGEASHFLYAPRQKP